MWIILLVYLINFKADQCNIILHYPEIIVIAHL